MVGEQDSALKVEITVDRSEEYGAALYVRGGKVTSWGQTERQCVVDGPHDHPRYGGACGAVVRAVVVGFECGLKPTGQLPEFGLRRIPIGFYV